MDGGNRTTNTNWTARRRSRSTLEDKAIERGREGGGGKSAQDRKSSWTNKAGHTNTRGPSGATEIMMDFFRRSTRWRILLRLFLSFADVSGLGGGVLDSWICPASENTLGGVAGTRPAPTGPRTGLP